MCLGRSLALFDRLVDGSDEALESLCRSLVDCLLRDEVVRMGLRGDGGVMVVMAMSFRFPRVLLGVN